MEKLVPKRDPELYAACVSLIAAGLEAKLADAGLVAEAESAINAATALIGMLKAEVKP